MDLPYCISGTDKLGSWVIEDSGEIPQMITDTAKGINGSIAYIFESYERTIKIEFRSESALTSFMNTLKANKGVFTYDTKDYLVQNISLIEFFPSSVPVFTYSLTLYRDGYS